MSHTSLLSGILWSLPTLVADARSAEFVQLASGPLPEAVCLVLKALDPDLAADDDLVAAVLAQARELGQS